MTSNGWKILYRNIRFKQLIFRPQKNPTTNFRIFRCSHSRKAMLRTLKIDSPAFHNILTPELKQLVHLFEKHEHEIRIAGGAVRDLLMDKTPHDIDFATTATPDQMKEMFNKEGVRMINAKGESHGTITARINDKDNFEVTTLRVDVVTDGRRAQVEFTKDWMVDANRRDLTINAMFLGFDGTLSDYFNGKEDLANRIVRFVGEPKERIQEDYLRILRYFRFYGRIATGPDGHDEGTLQSIKENGKGLKDVSGERIWLELRQIVCGNYASDIIKTMFSCGISALIGFPQECNTKELESVCANTEGLNCKPMTRIASICSDEEELYDFHARVKLSNDELSLGAFIVHFRGLELGDNPLRAYQYLQIDSPGEVTKVHEKICELIKYKGLRDVLEQFSAWVPPKFPVKGFDLVSANVQKGPVFHTTLNELRQMWKFSDFTLTKEQLMENLDKALEIASEKCKEGKHSPKTKKKKKNR